MSDTIESSFTRQRRKNYIKVLGTGSAHVFIAGNEAADKGPKGPIEKDRTFNLRTETST